MVLSRIFQALDVFMLLLIMFTFVMFYKYVNLKIGELNKTLNANANIAKTYRYSVNIFFFLLGDLKMLSIALSGLKKGESYLLFYLSESRYY